ncbi:MAG: carbon storage regulator, partial [Gammaproteobacteria bacterium]|nr:carbon storage regulator [Gammaproteobacteria bacterium]
MSADGVGQADGRESPGAGRRGWSSGYGTREWGACSRDKEYGKMLILTRRIGETLNIGDDVQ